MTAENSSRKADVRRRLVWLAVIFLVALTVRIVFVSRLQSGFYFWDSVRYDTAAMRLLEHGDLGPDYNRSPLYPAYLAGLYWLFGHSIPAVRIVESLLGALVALFLVIIGERLFNQRAGILAGLIWSFYPLAVFMAGLVYPEALTTFLLALGILMLVSGGQRPRAAALLASGACLSFAVLLKPVVIATIVFVAVWLFLFSSRPGSAAGSGLLAPSRLRPVGLFCAGAALCLGFSAGVNQLWLGRAFVTDPRALRFIDKAGSTNREEVNKGRIRRIIEDPLKAAGDYASEFAHFWQLTPDRVVMSDQKLRDKFHERNSRVVRRTVFGVNSLTSLVSLLSTGPVFLLALYGVISLARAGQWRELSLMAMVVLSFAFAYAFFFSQMRYRIPVEPYIIVVAGYGFDRLACWLRIDQWLLRRRRAGSPQVAVSESAR